MAERRNRLFRDRSIIHLDLDAFYASVEQLDFPQLRGRPVIVGGNSGRGVVCAASYEARRFGVHSAMPMMQAIRMCPEADVRPVRMQRYRKLSAQVFAIYRCYTDLVEPLSIDEAFLDVTASRRLFGTAVQIARQIRCRVRDETGLVVSAGVAPNKLLAKMASGQSKPDGLLEVSEEEVRYFLDPQPVQALWGIGRVSAQRLQAHGLLRIADLVAAGEQRVRRILGEAQGRKVHELAQGIDTRPVGALPAERTIGAEKTFAYDLYREGELLRALLLLAEEVGGRIRLEELRAQNITLKVRYEDFSTVSRRQSPPQPLQSTKSIYQAACELLTKTDAGSRPVRLLGITLGGLESADRGQFELFGSDREVKQARLDRTLDDLRQRFGSGGIVRGSLLPDDPGQ